MNELQIYGSEGLGDLVSLEAEQLTPSYYVEHYFDFLPRYVSNGNPKDETLVAYSREIKFFIGWCNSHRAHPLALKDIHCRLYLRYMIEKNYSQASIGLKLAAAKTFYNIAVKLGLIKNNPCAELRIKPSDTDDTKFKFLTYDKIKYIMKKISDEPDELLAKRNLAMFMLMTTEGLRNVEVHRMNDEDINFDMNTIYVRGKGHNDFIYPCNDTIICIKNYLRIRPPIKKDGVLTQTFISVSNQNFGERISRAGIRWAINQILTLSEMKERGYSCHMLRHSCGTNLYQATKDLRLVQETLRHRSPAVTSRYAHVYDRMNRRQTSIISPFSKDDETKIS